MPGMQGWSKVMVSVSVVVLLAAGCAKQAARPATSEMPAAAVPISDVASLAGKWRGWYTGASGSSQPLVVDVSPDGTYRSQTGAATGIGMFKVADGKIVAVGQFLGPGAPFERTAEATLTEKNGRRVITGQGWAGQRPYSFEIVKE